MKKLICVVSLLLAVLLVTLCLVNGQTPAVESGGRQNRSAAENHGTFYLNLPSKCYALVGEELNIYFDNLVDGHDTDYVFDVECSVGMQLERCYRLVPEKAGVFEIMIEATNREGVSVSKKSSIHVADTLAGANVSRSVIVLGDSTTNNGTAIAKLNSNFSSDPMTIRTLGTRGTEGNRHEGRSGWKFRRYFTLEVDKNSDDVLNPFFNPEKKTFDATFYFEKTGMEKPDYFFVNLGINDMFSFASDAESEKGIKELNRMYDAVIESVKKASPDTKIGVVLTIPPNYSQDAFGKSYQNGQTRARYKRNNVMWVDNLIGRYDKREDEGIFLIPIHTNLDTKYNMGMETIQHNKRNTKMTYESPLGKAGVHPAESGYWQIADIYWFFLKNMETEH